MRVAGLEPARHRCRRILSPLRLPIPPYPLIQLSKYIQWADFSNCHLSHTVSNAFRLVTRGKINTNQTGPITSLSVKLRTIPSYAPNVFIFQSIKYFIKYIIIIIYKELKFKLFSYSTTQHSMLKAYISFFVFQLVNVY